MAPEHAACLRRTLTALELEAAAEQLPPLNCKATAVLCRRLAAAALASMRDDVSVRHCIADHGQARLLAIEALCCWRLALAPEHTCQRRPAPPAAVRQLEGWWRAALQVLELTKPKGMDEPSYSHSLHPWRRLAGLAQKSSRSLGSCAAPAVVSCKGCAPNLFCMYSMCKWQGVACDGVPAGAIDHARRHEWCGVTGWRVEHPLVNHVRI